MASFHVQTLLALHVKLGNVHTAVCLPYDGWCFKIGQLTGMDHFRLLRLFDICSAFPTFSDFSVRRVHEASQALLMAE